MSDATQTPAAWAPDPYGRFQLRYWNGTVWTEHVSNNGQATTDAPIPSPAPPIPSVPIVPSIPAPPTTAVTTHHGAADVRAQVTGTGTRGVGVDPSLVPQGGGTIFTEPLLVVNQKRKLIELTNQYAVFSSTGAQIGSVNEVGQNAAKKAVRLLTNLDQFLTHTLEIRDNAGTKLLSIKRPAKIMKSKFVVSDGMDREIGMIVQENMIGKIRFAFQVNGQTIGALKAENWRAWNFRIEDHTGEEVARITKTWEGLLTTMFTTADNYVVQLAKPLPQPLLSMVVASALSIDTALKQDSRGLG